MDSTKISEVFAGLNRKFEEEETQRRAKQAGLPYFDLSGLPIDEEALILLSRGAAEAAGAIPFSRDRQEVKVGLLDPGSPAALREIKALEQKKYHVAPYLVSRSAFALALQQYKKILTPSILSENEISVTATSENLPKLRELAGSEARLLALPVSELWNLVIGSALLMDASDIHLEPEKDLLKLRFRVDGVLQDIVNFPKTLEQFLLSRIKLVAKMKLNVTAAPQDGRMSVKYQEKILDMRVSVLPSAFGESVVIRIFGTQERELVMEKLGINDQALPVIKAVLRRINGMILTTGPTGSGKTTTLYTFLNFLNTPGVKIITLEDPVEYQLEGIIQTPIDRAAGMDFAGGLRSILRQDPEVIMVGEIRDYETAETSCQAALTGHLVLSTLHTNDAAGAIPRLLDLGVKPAVLAPALTGLIAQRLLRRLCPDCKEIYRLPARELERVKVILSHIPKASKIYIPAQLVFYHSKGCEKCHHLGYRGRVGVFEVFAVDDRIQQLIHEQVSTAEIKKAAIEAGMITMQQDGILKALAGVTDLAEVWRVTEE